MLDLFKRRKKTSDTPENTADTQPIVEAPETPEKKGGFFRNLKIGLTRTRENFAGKIADVFVGKKIDAATLTQLEEQLIAADVGVKVARDIIAELKSKLSRAELADGDALLAALRQQLLAILEPHSKPLVIANNTANPAPFVILLVGVNGSGKTTTIGKLAKNLQNQGKKVMLAAGDTFRAAAIEQLQVWGQRNNVPVIAQHQGADSAAVLFDAMQAARARNIDVLLADTAGRLHNKSNLMDELKKIRRIMQKIDPTAPHEVLLVIDATFGQNALVQAREFYQEIGVTGICVTKLDGTAKGGILFAIAKELGLPIRFIGVGEKIDDLQEFCAADFVNALFE